MGSIQRLSSPEKMPRLQQSREARLCLSSRRPATAIAPFYVSSHSPTISLAKLNHTESYGPPNVRNLHLAMLLSKSGRLFDSRGRLRGKHGRSADSPTAACRASVLLVPRDAYGDRRGCSCRNQEKKPGGEQCTQRHIQVM